MSGDQEPEFMWDRVAGRSLERYLTARECELLERQAGEQPFGRTLDLGCGSGRIADHLRGHGADVVGIDPDRSAREAYQLRAPEAPLVGGDAEHVCCRDEAFDTVTLMQVLPYVDHQRCLAECARVLRPGGRIIFQALNANGYKAQLKRRARPQHQWTGANDVKPADLVDDLDRVGLRTIHTEGYNWLPVARNSDSGLVPWAEKAERLLHLRQFVRWSPWLLVVARKQETPTGRPGTVQSAA